MPEEEARLDLSGIVTGLRDVRERWRESQGRLRESGGREFPSRDALATIVRQLAGALFPMRLGPDGLRQESEDVYVSYTLDAALHSLLEQIRLELHCQARHGRLGLPEVSSRALAILSTFASQLPEIRALLDTDVLAAYHGDPAARSVDEVLLCYPGILAVIHHRIAHRLYLLGVPLIARIIAELAHGETGIDIHPGARIGPSFFIDHGTGVVIGETAVIGHRVRLYQAVTLGAKRFDVEEDGALAKGGARHPQLEDDVVVYAGATILGRITIGAVVRRQRRVRGWSQEELADRAGLSRSYGGEVERGDAVPSLVTVIKLAHAFEMQPSALMAQAEGDGHMFRR
ncbi:helix-turn-helix domain-containing protein [Zoogloea sp.]|uniref:helix-turn-helix domain-containing protein n=1 Tax=Zoogloea sp. TaxID=49181 RepID=UPI0035B2C326